MRIDKRNNDLKKILKIVSVNTNVPVEVVEEVFSNYYKEIESIISNLNNEDILNYPTFKIPFFGKLYISEAKKKHLNKVINGEDKIE